MGHTGGGWWGGSARSAGGQGSWGGVGGEQWQAPVARMGGPGGATADFGAGGERGTWWDAATVWQQLQAESRAEALARYGRFQTQAGLGGGRGEEGQPSRMGAGAVRNTVEEMEVEQLGDEWWDNNCLSDANCWSMLQGALGETVGDRTPLGHEEAWREFEQRQCSGKEAGTTRDPWRRDGGWRGVEGTAGGAWAGDEERSPWGAEEGAPRGDDAKKAGVWATGGLGAVRRL